MHTRELIMRCENDYNDVLRTVASAVKADRRKTFIMVTGASCAGKTTTTKKLGEYFAELGVHAEKISLDDYYKNRADIPLGDDGRPDLESIDSLDTALLSESLTDLAAGREVRIPRFDFVTQRRSDESETLTLDPGEVVIIEGLHALNPRICESLAKKGSVYRIYLNAEAESYDAKLLRRIVRDSYYRGSDAEQTLSMWDAVTGGEKKYISPYAGTADTVINTFFAYETRLLSVRGKELLSKVPDGSPFRAAADALSAVLAPLDPIDYATVPDDSLMLEFIKK